MKRSRMKESLRFLKFQKEVVKRDGLVEVVWS